MAKEHALAVWRKQTSLSQSDLAVKLGISRWMVNSIETGRRSPSMGLASKVQELTGGKVTPNDFSQAEVAS